MENVQRRHLRILLFNSIFLSALRSSPPSSLLCARPFERCCGRGNGWLIATMGERQQQKKEAVGKKGKRAFQRVIIVISLDRHDSVDLS